MDAFKRSRRCWEGKTVTQAKSMIEIKGLSIIYMTRAACQFTRSSFGAAPPTNDEKTHQFTGVFIPPAPCVRQDVRDRVPTPPPGGSTRFVVGLGFGVAIQTFSWCLSATEQMRPRSCEKPSRALRSILPPHCLARGHTGSLCGCRTRAALHWQMNGWRKSARADTCARRRAKSDKKTRTGGGGGVIS